ncbi:MAG: ATP-binding cassette domain-containing protein [Alphaproteobacteria bacterium]
MAEIALAPEAGPILSARDLTRRFGDFTAVDHIRLQVEPGEVFGLLGANGAGKTTTIRMLCGLLPPTAGQIRLADVDMVRYPRHARARLGYVTQHFALYRELSVRENLQLQAGLYGLNRDHARQRIEWALQHLDLAARAESRAGALPLGFRRRLDLAAALLHQPRILFLDEPTSGVDPLARQQFWELIYELAEAGIAILVTTHYMDEASYCDRLAMMHAGRIIAEGSPDDLLARPLPTPLLEVRGEGCAACARWLADWPEVIEIIPHAGYLRLRLQPGTDPEVLGGRLRAEAQQRGQKVTAIATAEPDLEDVFVTLLETEEDRA